MQKKIFSRTRLLAVVFICSIFLGIGMGAVYVKRDEPKDVPEIAKILDPATSQDDQLKAGRALAVRVGPKEALELLRSSGLPYTGEGHFVVHQVGFVAWERYKEKALLYCEDYFLYACYHGAIIEAASSEGGFETVKKMTDECRELEPRYVQCVHAAGHAILAIWNYEVDRALPTCDELFGQEAALTYCHSGVFMENIFGVHDWDKNKRSPDRKWLSETDIYYPCNAFGQEYQAGCWQNQATRIYEMYGGDIAKTAQACEDADSRYVSWCFDSLARQIHPMSENDPAKVYSLCLEVGEKWKDNCISVNAGAYFSVGDGPTGIAVCNSAPTSAQEACFGTVTSYVLGANASFDQKRDLCRLMNQNFSENCLRALES